jgi:uncharacterized membrane protein YfcA
MYDMMPIIFGVMMIVLGLYMVKDPVHATKKSLRQDENAVKKVKRNGFIEIGCGIVLIIIGLI